MIQSKNQNILYTQTQIIYVAMQCLNFFQLVHVNGQILKSAILINIIAIVRNNVFLKLIFNILKSYENYIMINRQLQAQQKQKRTCWLSINYTVFVSAMLKNKCLSYFYKEKYVIHYQNLKVYFRLGFKLKKKIAHQNSGNHTG